MRDPERRRASKRAYYERHKARLQSEARDRYAAERPPAAIEETAVIPRRRRALGRDSERRKASRQAYYNRNRALLREKARARMARVRATKDAAGLLAARLKMLSYRNQYYDLLRNRRLNLYRKRWMLKNGVSQFLARFRGRVQAPRGELLEHWDHDTLQTVVSGSTD